MIDFVPERFTACVSIAREVIEWNKGFGFVVLVIPIFKTEYSLILNHKSF